MLKKVVTRCVSSLQWIHQRSNMQLTCSTKPTLTTTSALAQSFELLNATELTSVIEAYNHILPTVYQKKHLLDTVEDDVLYELFDVNYLDREVLIDMVMHRATKSQTSLPEPTQPATQNKLPYTIQLWLRPQETNKYWTMRAIQTIMYGQPLVIDCGYEHLMASRRELPSYIRQLHHCVTQNLKSKDPFDLTFCNLTESSVLHKDVSPNNSWNALWVNKTSKCFTELYDKQDIIMLSPDAPLYLERFDRSKVYVIGGLVDLADATPVSYAKAQALGVECRKLPIDIWIHWRASKRLALPTVVNILATLSETGDWRTAFERSLAQRQVQSGNVCRLYTGKAGGGGKVS